MRNLLGIMVILLSLSACSNEHTSNTEIETKKPERILSDEQTWNLITGNWYGSQPTKDGGKRKELKKRFRDGTYEITFRTYDKEGNYEDQIEVGQWGISGPVFFTIFRGWKDGTWITQSSPDDPHNYDAYRIIKLNDEVFEYEHYVTGNRFANKRVSEDFELPD